MNPGADGGVLALLAVVMVIGVVAGVLRLLRKPALHLTPVDRLIASMLLGRFFAPLRARFQPEGTDAQPLPMLVCPLCGAANECAPAKQGIFSDECWCTRTSVKAEALARVPDALKGKACLCRACATGEKAARSGMASAKR